MEIDLRVKARLGVDRREGEWGFVHVLGLLGEWGIGD